MELTGSIKVIGVVNEVTPTYKKRDLVITTDEQYPQHIMVEFSQDKCDLLNSFTIGETVNVGINLRGREWVNPQGEAKYFNSIQGWRISKPKQDYSSQTNQQYQAQPTQYGQPKTWENQGLPQSNNEPEDDLPF